MGFMWKRLSVRLIPRMVFEEAYTFWLSKVTARAGWFSAADYTDSLWYKLGKVKKQISLWINIAKILPDTWDQLMRTICTCPSSLPHMASGKTLQERKHVRNWKLEALRPPCRYIAAAGWLKSRGKKSLAQQKCLKNWKWSIHSLGKRLEIPVLLLNSSLKVWE